MVKVRELITELMKHDQELEIYLQGYSADDGGTGEIYQVYTSHDGDLTIEEGKA